MNNSKQKRKYSIRFTVLGIFICVSTLLSGMSLGLQYYFGVELAESAAKRLFKGASSQVSERLETMDSRHLNMVVALEHYINLIYQFKQLDTTGIYTENFIFLPTLTALMQRNSSLYAIYVSLDSESTFLELVNLNSGKLVRQTLGAQDDDRWIVIGISTIDGKRQKKMYFFNEDLVMRTETTEYTDYTPQSRPWYQKAVQANGVVRTEPYIFNTLNSLGVSYAKKLGHNKGVLGIDIALDSLSDFLSKQDIYPQSELALFSLDSDFRINAKTGQSDVKASGSVLQKELLSGQKLLSLTPSLELKGGIGKFEVEGKSYFYFVDRLEASLASSDYLGILTPAEVVEAPYLAQVRVSIGIAIGLLLLLTPLIWYLATLIVRPIKALVVENDKIKDRRIDDVRIVDSRIKEVFELSQSIMSMALSIKAYEEAQRVLMDSIIKLVAGAIDAKSPYTGGHCSRVPVIAYLLAKAANQSSDKPFADFAFETEEQWREFYIGSWLHDCGKVTTPEFVVDKATKLETIYNRIHEIRTRFEVLLRDKEIEYYRRLEQNDGEPGKLETWLKEEEKAILEDFAFVAECNIGGEFMTEDKMLRIKQIAGRTWKRRLSDRIGLSQEELRRLQVVSEPELPVSEPVLSDRAEHVLPRTQDPFGNNPRGFVMDVPNNLYNYGEIYNLCIQRGTLTAEERFKINEHIIQSIIMLEALPFPEGLKRVPEYASAHHETLIGTGYPRKLKKDDMSIPARILAVADVFEALTAADRPYKKAKPLSQAIKIMSFMVKDQHLDPELFELFLSSGAYLEYARQYLNPNQIDDVDVTQYCRSSGSPK